MERSDPDSYEGLVNDRKAETVSSDAGSESYMSADQIASDLKTGILAEFRYGEEIESWERDVSLLSESGWVSQCERLVEKLVQLREVSPLDVVAVCALTGGVPMRAFLCSLGIAVRKVLQRVVLLDCDLRSPSLHTVTGAEGLEGFIDMVKYGCSFFTASRETYVSGLYVVGAGSHPVSSEGELVGKDLDRTFNSLRTKADVTFACIPPLLMRRRVNPILACVDGALVCFNRSSATRPEVIGVFTRLWQSDVPIVGAVNLESQEFEERRTFVLGADSRAAAPPEAPQEAVPVSGEGQVHSAAPDLEAVLPDRIQLEYTPECRPLLAEGEKAGDAETMFGGILRAGAETGEPVLGGADAASPEGHKRRMKRRSWRRVRSAEEHVLERELFGRRRISPRLAYLIGIPLVAAVLVALAVVSPRLVRGPGQQVDTEMMRSILLPGADGVVGADEVGETPGSKAQVPGEQADQGLQERVPSEALPGATEPGSSEPRTSQARTSEAKSSGPPLMANAPVDTGVASGVFYIHVSSHKAYRSASEDSATVARAGFPVYIQFVRLSQLGRWYRVIAGPFQGASAAQSAASKIEPLGIVKKVRIIQEGEIQ